MKLNRGDTVSTTPVSVGGDRNEGPIDGMAERSPSWWFDGDDDNGWLPYDEDSSQKLENAFQALRLDSTTKKGQHPNRIVLLSGGRYSVDVQAMEQVNTESHFLRLVRRVSAN